MKENYNTRFVEMLEEGAAVQDIHDSPKPLGYAVVHRSSRQFVERELGRVEQHRKNACWLLEEYVGPAEKILDAGCGTGGFSVAMASSRVLSPAQVIGIDVSRLAVEAARVRAIGYDLPPNLLSFSNIVPGERLPFVDNYFNLTVSSSVIEFVTCREARENLIKELARVTKPGGYVFISTPNPLRLREYHSGRFLGDYIRRTGYPWANSPWELTRMFSGWQNIPITKYYRRKLEMRLGTLLPIPEVVVKGVSWIAPWQNRLFHKVDERKVVPFNKPANSDIRKSEKNEKQ